jgi:alpha 1,2-mannosyltransferase
MRFRPSTPLLAAILFLLAVTLPAAYTHHRDPTIIPSFFTTTTLPPWIPAASGGIRGVPLTLEDRLSYLLSRPALAQWEAELPSRHACPFYTYSRNTYFFHGEDKQQFWEATGPDQIREYRSKMVEYLRNVERKGGKLVWEKGMDGGKPKRGLIMTGGQGVS